MTSESPSQRIEERLTALFPSIAFEDRAEAIGVVERDSKIQIPALVWAFVLGFVAGKPRTFAVFRRAYNATANKTLPTRGQAARDAPVWRRT